MTDGAVCAAILGGAALLAGSRDREGWWRDFDRKPHGSSDEWTTAYIATTMGRLDLEQSREAARDAWRLLLTRQSPDGGWAFNRSFGFDDADSTGWALQLARVIGEEHGEAVERARAFVGRHLQGDGGIATFVNVPAAWVGWTVSHACVTAAIGSLPEFLPRVHSYLLGSQHPDGSWTSYWAAGREYATALACEALSASGRVLDCGAVDRAVEWAIKRPGPDGAVGSILCPDGSPFATACCLRILRLSSQHEAREAALAAANWLLATQRADGSWAPAYDMRLTLASVRDPDLVTGIFPEVNLVWLFPEIVGLFTTATVVEALRRWSH